MNFKDNLKPKTVVELIDDNRMPHFVISAKALAKMYNYVLECKYEIGWLGTVYKDDEYFIIDDVYLFKQEVHETTTEITTEGLSEFASEILKEDNGIEVWNSIRLWGHSHVNMGISPSHTDDIQMAVFDTEGVDWFVRLIANKKGDLSIDFYDYASNIAYQNVSYEYEHSAEESDIQKQINLLSKQLTVAKDKSFQVDKEAIKVEVKDKVKYKWEGGTKFTYPTKLVPKLTANELAYLGQCWDLNTFRTELEKLGYANLTHKQLNDLYFDAQNEMDFNGFGGY